VLYTAAAISCIIPYSTHRHPRRRKKR